MKFYLNIFLLSVAALAVVHTSEDGSEETRKLQGYYRRKVCYYNEPHSHDPPPQSGTYPPKPPQKGTMYPPKAGRILDANFCILLDDSCGLDESECDTQFFLAAEIMSKMKLGATPPFCFGQFADGASTDIVFDDVGLQNDTDEIYRLLTTRTGPGGGLVNCRKSQLETDLYNGLELIKTELEVGGGVGTRDIEFILSNCVQNSEDGSEADVCGEYGSYFTSNDVEMYIINIETLSATTGPAGLTNFGVGGNSPIDLYLSCLTNNPITTITQANVDGIYNIIMHLVGSIRDGYK